MVETAQGLQFGLDSLDVFDDIVEVLCFEQLADLGFYDVVFRAFEAVDVHFVDSRTLVEVYTVGLLT